MSDIHSLTIIWCSVFISYWLAKRTRLTPVLFYLVMGSLLVTVGILPEKSSPFINGFAEFGIILIMFALGFEENPILFVKSIKRTWGIAFFGALGPFTVAYFIALYLWNDQNIALLVGLTMTATAVSLTMVALKHERLHHTKAATGIMTSAVLDDVASLVLVATLVPIVSGSEGMTLDVIVTSILNTMAFVLLILFTSYFLFPGKESRTRGPINRLITDYGLHDILAFSEGKVATLAILTIALIFGGISHYFGLHPALGAYMAGLVMQKRYFYISKQGETIYTYKKTRKIIDDVAFVLIGPVFFVNLGSKLVLEVSQILAVIDMAILLTLAVFIIQVISAAVAARYTGSFNFVESVMIGFGMLGRAELAFVVMDIGYIDYQIFSKDVFYTLMFTSFALNFSVPICIRFWRPYFTGEKQVFWQK